MKGGPFTKQKSWIIAAAVAVFILALGIVLYPLISTWYNDRHESQIQTHYEEVLAEIDDTELTEARRLAQSYNQAILPGTQAEESYSQEALQDASLNYANQLNPAGDGIMGYVEVPRIGIDLPIYHGTETEILDIGVGHLLGSSLPIGGSSCHSVLTAHSGMASRKLFSDLDQLGEGDIFYVKVLGETMAYQVDLINKVLPHDTTFLGIEEGKDLCTLVTCTPFGVNTHRLLVRGTRIPYEEAESQVAELIEADVITESTWEKQYISGILCGLGAVAVIGVVYFILRLRRRGKYEAV